MFSWVCRSFREAAKDELMWARRLGLGMGKTLPQNSTFDQGTRSQDLVFLCVSWLGFDLNSFCLHEH